LAPLAVFLFWGKHVAGEKEAIPILKARVEMECNGGETLA